MLDQAAITQSVSPVLSVVPVVRSASDSRALVILQSVLIKGTNENYLSHPTFHDGFEAGYTLQDEFGMYEDEELTFEGVLNIIQEHLSFLILQRENEQLVRLKMEPTTYEHRVGFVLGFLRWLVDAGRTPVVPLSLLQKWYSIEHLTRSVAGRFVAYEQTQQPVKQTITLGTYWE